MSEWRIELLQSNISSVEIRVTRMNKYECITMNDKRCQMKVSFHSYLLYVCLNMQLVLFVTLLKKIIIHFVLLFASFRNIV